MFNKMYGEEALFEEALNAVLPTAYDAAVKEAGIEPVAQPKIDVAKMEKGSDWELTAEVVVKPTVSLGDYKDLTVEVEATKEVSDEEVETRLTNSQNNLAELVVKETAAENGDTVVIDLRWIQLMVLNLKVEKVLTTVLNLVQVNSFQDLKNNLLELKLVKL